MFLNATGTPTGVAVSDLHFFATSGARAARLRWITGSEQNLEGFHLLRSEAEDGDYQRITTDIIPAKGDGYDYSFSDEAVVPNRTYYYKIEARSLEESSLLFGPYEFVYRVRFALEQNFPNPFNPTTKIRFTIPEDSPVNLTVYDVAGRKV